MMLKHFWYTVLFLSMACSITAQVIDEKNFILYTTKDGLSSNAISGIVQDKYGYIWVSTYKGLNRFDGNSFKQFFSDSSSNSLPVDQIFKLKWLNDEELGVLTFVGLHIINTRTLKTRNLFIPSAPKKQVSSRVIDIEADKKGNLFLINTGGFYHFNKKDELVFRFDYAAEGAGPGVKNVFGLGIAKTEDNVLLLSGFHGPYIYHVDEKELHPVTEKDGPFYSQFTTGDKLFMIAHEDSTSFSAMVPDADAIKNIKQSQCTNDDRNSKPCCFPEWW